MYTNWKWDSNEIRSIHKQHSSTTIKTNFMFLFLHSTFFCSTLLFIACLCRFHFWRKFLSWWRQQRIVFQLANIFSIHIKYRALSPFFRIQSEWKIKLFCYCLMARLMLCVDICMRRVWSFHSYFNKKRNRCEFKSLLDINWNWNTILFTNVLNIHFHRKGSPRILWPLSFDWDVNKSEYTKCNGVEWQCIAMAYDSSIFISMTPLDAGLTTSEHWLHTPSIYRRDFRKFYQKKIPTKYWMWAKKALLLVNTIHCLSMRHPECCHSFFSQFTLCQWQTNKLILLES